jgi:hypothetical protein
VRLEGLGQLKKSNDPMGIGTRELPACRIIIRQKKKKLLEGNMFWDVTPHSSAEVHLSFGGKYCFHLQGRRVIQVKGNGKVAPVLN